MTPLHSWLFLAGAIVCEVAATTCMKLSDGLTKWIWVVPMLAGYLLALGGLALALRHIEVGIAYAVWAGAGTLLIALIGIAFFSEGTGILKLASMALVIVGVAGLNLADVLSRG
jgi:small multidrug resistance pump